MPQLTYNGLTLPFTDTTGFKQQVVTENGHYVRTDHDLTVNSTLTPESICLPGETFTAALARVRHTLEVPRRPLYVFFDSAVPYLSIPAADASDGPIVRVVDLHTFAGTQSAHLTFGVRTSTRDCPNATGGVPGWTYHAFRESIDLDDRHATTVTRSGLIRFRGDYLTKEFDAFGNYRNVTADAFRGIVSPNVPNSFLRVSSRYEVQEDGLALRYTFVDKEQFCMPPEPAVKAAMRSTVSTSNGAKMYAQVNCTLVGRMDGGNHRDPQPGRGRDTGINRLLETAVALCMHQLRKMTAPPGDRGRWLITGEVSVDHYEGSVSVALRTLVTPPKRTQQVVGGVGGGQTSSAGAALAGAGILGVMEAAAQKAKAVGRGGVGGEVPRGLARLGMGEPPLGSDRRPPEVGRGSAPFFKLVSAVLGDPCLDALFIEGELRQGRFEPPAFGRSGAAGGGSGLPAPEGVEAGAAGGAVPADLPTPTPPNWPQLPPAEVTVTELVSDPLAEAEAVSDGRVWTHCELRPRVVKDKGRVARTEMRAGGLTRVIQVRAESVKYVVEWEADRVGAPPEIPPEEHPDGNFVLLESVWSPGTVDVGADGVTLIHSAAGRYEYAVVDPSLLEAGAAFYPWAAEVLGKGTGMLVSGGPVLVDPSAASELRTDGKEAWQAALEEWANDTSEEAT